MNTPRRIFLWTALLLQLTVYAARVDTVWIESAAMKRSFRCVVIVPDRTKTTQERFPVTYLLHGYGGHYDNWIKKVPEIARYADDYRMLVVCPEGQNNWYLNSPVNDSIQWETYIGAEVPAYIDSHYPTRADRNSRAITGLSMGGHGGLFLPLQKPDIFGAGGSMSGGVDLLPFPGKWQLNLLLGDPATQSDQWKAHSVMQRIDTPLTRPTAFIIDCGTEDFFFEVNQALHQKMIDKKIAHDYIVRPGKHDWNYWRQALPYQLVFFYRFFYGDGN